ncbi:retrovirus-related pol polyprotein from transposon TNT 1-94 [Tanacetum coccineum]|uniref:Retrovirus-related pol polyprotein from transposon TNT 1-94 n=1 Tax=Tanacetum coccineum TaxID=301880 RepID=A0ABQ5ANN0_9ASTR
MRVESINRKRYVLVFVDDYSRYTWAFFLRSKYEALEVIISFIKKTQVNLQLQVQRVQTDNGTEFKNNNAWLKPSQQLALQYRSLIHKHFYKTPYELINMRKPNIKFFHVFDCRCYLLNGYDDVGKLKAKGDIGVFVGYSKESASFIIYNKHTRKIHESVNVNFDEIFEMASKQFSFEPDNEISTNECYDEIPSHEEEVFYEISESFQEESSSSSLNDDVQQSSEEAMVPPTNTQSVSNESVPNVNEASTSHNVFYERLEDAYNIEPANISEALKDADWVSAMQEELDQFARLKVWRLVPRPKGRLSSIPNGFSRIRKMKAVWLFETKQGLSLKDIVYKKALTMMKCLLQLLELILYAYFLHMLLISIS